MRDRKVNPNELQEAIADQIREHGEWVTRDPLWFAEQLMDDFKYRGWKVVENA